MNGFFKSPSGAFLGCADCSRYTDKPKASQTIYRCSDCHKPICPRHRKCHKLTCSGAQLGAVAPELLEALKGLRKLCDKASIPLVNSHAVRDMGKFLKACEAADKAIEKAEPR